MKTINHQQPLLCEKDTRCSPYLSWALSFQSLYAFLLVKRKSLSRALTLRSLNRAGVVYALREIPATLHALAYSATVNLRIYAGLVMVWVMAPLASCVYQLFDPALNMDPNWYHINWYYFLNALGPYISLFVGLVGMYFVFPPSRRTFLIAIPTIGWAIAKIVKIILCTSNKEWHENISIPVFVIGVCSAVVLLVSVDWLAWRKYHKFDSIPARIKGVIQMPGIDAETKLKLIEKENAKLFTFHKEY